MPPRERQPREPAGIHANGSESTIALERPPARARPSARVAEAKPLAEPAPDDSQAETGVVTYAPLDIDELSDPLLTDMMSRLSGDRSGTDPSSVGDRAARPVAVPVETLPAGAEINHRYVVERTVGRGGMGVVYKVKDPIHPERDLALKTIWAQSVAKTHLELFKAEFTIMTKLAHPGVAQVYDLEPIQGSDDYLITLGYIEGEDIFSATHDASWERIVEVLVQTCRALAYMHSRGIIHFDLKPENVLVDVEGKIKILDFGIAGAKPSGKNDQLVGTPSYMAPEMLLERSAIDHRYDLYSLGIIFYKLLTRQMPFMGSSTIGILKAHCWQPIVFGKESRRRVPAWLRELIVKLCAKKPADRFRHANAVIEAINASGDTTYEIETQETKESYIASSGFVGREREFTEVLDYINHRTGADATPRPPALLVGGQSGSGKSRLMREVRYHVQLSRVPFVEVSCYENVASEFGPIVAILEYLVRAAESLTAHQELLSPLRPVLRRLAPHLLGEDDAQRASAARDRQDRQDRQEAQQELELITKFLRDVSRVYPYVLYINDLQWARRSTVEMLRYLVLRLAALGETEAEPARLALVLSYRNDEWQGRPIEGFLDAVAGDADSSVGVVQISIGNLGRDDVGDVVRSMLGVTALPDAFTARLFDQTDGNPYFVEEVMRVLVERGRVYVDRGEWAMEGELGELQIPSLDEVFLERASLLEDDARRVLEVLAACSRPVCSRLLQAASQLEPDVLNQHLATLIRRKMVKRERDEQVLLRTAHDRIRSSIYASLGDAPRRALHGDIGRAYERVHGEHIAEHYYELAYHFEQAGDDDKTLEYCVLAGARASQRYETAQSIEYTSRSLALLEARGQRDQARWHELQEQLADLQFRNGQLDEAARSYEQRLASCADAMARARVLQKLGDAAREQGEIELANDHFWAALTMLGDRKPRSLPLVLGAIVGALLTHLGYRAMPRRVAQVRDADARERLESKVRLYFSLTTTCFHRDPLLLALAGFRAANLMDRNRGGTSALRVEADLMLAMLWVGLGNNEKSSAFIDQAHALAREADIADQLISADSFRSLVRYLEGDWDECVRLSEDCLQRALKQGDFLNYGAVSTNIFNPLFYRGQLRYAWAITDSMIALQRRTGTLLFGYFCSIQRCALRVLMHGEDVQDELDALERELSELTLWLLVGDLFYRAADVALQRGDYQRSIDYCERLEQEIIKDKNFANGFLAIVYPLAARAWVEKYRAEAEHLDGRARRRLWRQVTRRAHKAQRTASSFPIYRAWAQLALGEREWLAHNYQASRLAFDASIAAANELQAELWLAHAHFGAGRCYVERADSREDGRAHLRQALEIFERCGARIWKPRIMAILESEH